MLGGGGVGEPEALPLPARGLVEVDPVGGRGELSGHGLLPGVVLQPKSGFHRWPLQVGLPPGFLPWCGFLRRGVWWRGGVPSEDGVALLCSLGKAPG